MSKSVVEFGVVASRKESFPPNPKSVSLPSLPGMTIMPALLKISEIKRKATRGGARRRPPVREQETLWTAAASASARIGKAHPRDENPPLLSIPQMCVNPRKFSEPTLVEMRP